ncbi:TMV resistance protein N-like [Cicer arietinum]|uniref:TMV resistance protein N-like n=1 Tax=Cicer arietinum TaxID=3827 RepID=UPI000640C081
MVLDQRDILNRVVTYASGLQLALEVVGSNLYGKDIQEWKSLLDEYERIPNKDIQEILLVSYNNLSELHQNVFLDIACCFKGYCLKEVENILSAHHGLCMKYQIGLLVDKSLIKINEVKYVTLHNLIEMMGKEIVRKESVIELGECSRLWFYKDIVHVLTENTQLHEAGETAVCFLSIGDEMIPNWFEHQSKGGISFWFCNRIPSFAIFVSTKKEYGCIYPPVEYG